MWLIHCHKQLSSKSKQRLLLLLATSQQSGLVFRESAIENLTDTIFIAECNSKSSVYWLTDDSEQLSDEIRNSNNITTISYAKFVELCAIASKIIAWK